MNNKVLKIALSAFFLALGIIIPKLFHLFQIPGTIFLPMHIPVLLAGFCLGKKYGLIVGALTPLLSFFISSTPPFIPVGLPMMFELAAYGFLAGFFYRGKQIIFPLFLALLGGRIVLALANFILFFILGNPYTFSIFFASAFITPFPGIIIQIILVPLIVLSLQHSTILNKVK